MFRFLCATDCLCPIGNVARVPKEMLHSGMCILSWRLSCCDFDLEQEAKSLFLVTDRIPNRKNRQAVGEEAIEWKKGGSQFSLAAFPLKGSRLEVVVQGI